MENWRHQIGPFSHMLVDELSKRGEKVRAVNVADSEYDPDLPEDVWSVRLKLAGEADFGNSIEVTVECIQDSSAETIAEIIHTLHKDSVNDEKTE